MNKSDLQEKVRAYRGRKAETVEDRFWASVDKSDGCWEWTGAAVRGYGQIGFGGKVEYTHRVSWVIHNGRISDNMDILHSCDNPGCVNPAHLFEGTHQDNMTDRDTKGRLNHRVMLGDEARYRKLNSKQVLSIRSLYPKISQSELGRMFDVCSGTIFQIVHRRTWRHI